MFSCLCSVDAPRVLYQSLLLLRGTNSVSLRLFLCLLDAFLNRILQAESSFLVGLSHRALRHYCLLSIAVYGGSLSLHRTDSHPPVSNTGIYSIPEQVSSYSSDCCQVVSRVQTNIGALPAVLAAVFHSIGFCKYSYLLTSPVPLLSIDRISRLYCVYSFYVTLPRGSPCPLAGIASPSHRIATGSELSTQPDRVLPGRPDPEEPKTRLALLTAALRIFLNFLVIFFLPVGGGASLAVCLKSARVSSVRRLLPLSRPSSSSSSPPLSLLPLLFFSPPPPPPLPSTSPH